MTLETALLQKVPEWRPTPHERASLAVAEQDGPWCARLVADRCEELGIALWEFRLERLGTPLVLNDEQLSDWAKTIVESPPLLDPLSIIELDRSRGKVQIRAPIPRPETKASSFTNCCFHEPAMSASIVMMPDSKAGRRLPSP